MGAISPAVSSVGFSGKMEDIFRLELPTRVDLGANAEKSNKERDTGRNG